LHQKDLINKKAFKDPSQKGPNEHCGVGD